MSVVSVEKIKGRRTAAKNNLWQRTYSRVYRVRTNDPADEGPVVLNAVDPNTNLAIPNVGAVFSTVGATRDLGAFVQSIDAQEEDEDGLSWVVTAQYGPFDASLFSANPVEWPIKLAISGQTFERVVYIDRDGNPIVNSAGIPFAEPVTIDQSRYVITVTRNELAASFDLALGERFSDKTNNALWNGFAVDTAKCGTITPGEAQYDSNNQAYYFSVQYPFAIDRDGWYKKLLDQGFQALDSSSPPKAVPITEQGQPITEPVLLDGSGHRLASTGTPVFLVKKPFFQDDFSVLGIDFRYALGLN